VSEPAMDFLGLHTAGMRQAQLSIGCCFQLLHIMLHGLEPASGQPRCPFLVMVVPVPAPCCSYSRSTKVYSRPTEGQPWASLLDAMLCCALAGAVRSLLYDHQGSALLLLLRRVLTGLILCPAQTCRGPPQRSADHNVGPQHRHCVCGHGDVL
jgi:hypothetical protein